MSAERNVKSLIRAGFLVAVVALGTMPATAETPSALEALEPSTALAEVKTSRGVIFVDLYAEF